MVKFKAVSFVPVNLHFITKHLAHHNRSHTMHLHFPPFQGFLMILELFNYLGNVGQGTKKNLMKYILKGGPVISCKWANSLLVILFNLTVLLHSELNCRIFSQLNIVTKTEKNKTFISGISSDSVSESLAGIKTCKISCRVEV